MNLGEGSSTGLAPQKYLKKVVKLVDAEHLEAEVWRMLDHPGPDLVARSLLNPEYSQTLDQLPSPHLDQIHNLVDKLST